MKQKLSRALWRVFSIVIHFGLSLAAWAFVLVGSLFVGPTRVRAILRRATVAGAKINNHLALEAASLRAGTRAPGLN